MTASHTAIGTSTPRVDGPQKVAGTAPYAYEHPVEHPAARLDRFGESEKADAQPPLRPLNARSGDGFDQVGRRRGGQHGRGQRGAWMERTAQRPGQRDQRQPQQEVAEPQRVVRPAQRRGHQAQQPRLHRRPVGLPPHGGAGQGMARHQAHDRRVAVHGSAQRFAPERHAHHHGQQVGAQSQRHQRMDHRPHALRQIAGVVAAERGVFAEWWLGGRGRHGGGRNIRRGLPGSKARWMPTPGCASRPCRRGDRDLRQG